MDASTRELLVFALLVLALLQVTPVFSSEIGGKKGVTLTFVFDSTGSMSDELQQVKDGTQAIFKTMLEHPDKPIYNYALVPFNDPTVGPVTVTTDPVQFNNSLKAITVSGGGDCPELAMAGIKLAVEESLPGSYIYVFTDASAKDYSLRAEVENIIQRKQSQVVFVLTGDCNGHREPGYQAYHSIASTSSGQVFNIKKDEVKKVLAYVKSSVQERNKVVIRSEHKPGPAKTEFGVPVDETMDVLTLSVSGKDPKVEVRDPHGTKKEGDKILDVPEAIVVSISHPEPGNWSIKTSSSSEHDIRVTSVSEFTFTYGFSTVSTHNMAETAPRPLIGVNTALLVKITNQTQLSHLTKLLVKNLSGTTLHELNLVAVPGEPYVYMVDMFTPPTSLFVLEVHGLDKTDKPISRTSPTAISPQPPAPPIITLPASVTAIKNTPYTVKCHVESLVPFTATWLKNGRALGPEESFKQSAEVLLHLPTPTKSSEGKYTCHAKNVAGTTSQDTQLTITAPPPQVETPDKLRVRPGEKGEVPCRVESELDYTVSWARVPDTGDPRPVSGSRFVAKKTGNLMIDLVEAGDQGWYQCTAQSKVGKGEGRVYVEVREPVHVSVIPDKLNFMRGTFIKLSCLATGSPKLTLQWRKDGRTIEKSDPRLREPAKDTLDLMIVHTDSSTEGRYECEARNDIDKDVGVAELVYEEEPTATAVQSHIQVLNGTSALLQCTVTGVPKPVLTWSRDGKEIIPNVEFKVLADGSLSIPAVARGGDFQCIARNKVGGDEDAVTLEVGTAPQIVELPHDVGVDIMTDGSVPCNVAGFPKPTITWSRRDGRKMDPERFSYNDSCTLTITVAAIEDEGTYIVTVENEFGKEEKETEITITGIVNPVLDKSGELNVSTVAREFVELSCVVLEGNPPPIITWYKDGEQLDEAVEGAKLQANGSLIVPYVTLRNGGGYECEASNIGGKARKSMQMNVLEPPTFSRAKRALLKVRRGKDVQLPCVVQGKPKPMVMWTKDGAPLFSSTTIGRSPKDDSLLIKKASESNNGTYKCVAKNSGGMREKIIDLLVQDPPRIITGVEETYPIKEENITFYCEVTAYPPAEVKWLKDGVPVSADRVAHLENNASISFTADSSYSGRYECIATNEAGMDKSGINVTVMDPPEFEVTEQFVTVSAGQDVTLPCYTDAFPPAEYFWSSSSGVTLDDDAVYSSILTLQNVQSESTGVYICEATNYAGSDQKVFYVKVNVPPKIHVDFPDKEDLIQGSDYKLPCSADGSPAPTITWKKDGKTLPAPDTDEEGVLLIRAATHKDSGLYTCTAVNSEGADHKNLVINVLVPPIMGDPEMAAVEVKEGAKNLLISCPAIEANPPPTIQWLKDARYLDTMKRTARKIAKDGGRALRLWKITLEDAGVYTCVASNAAGSTRADITVKVLTKPSFKIVTPLLSLSEVEGSSITLDCSSTGYPPPKVSWYRNGHPLLDFTNPDMIWSPNNQVLQIPRARSTDTGEYSCVAENKVATVERNFKLEVYVFIPEFEGFPDADIVSEWASWSPWSPCSASCGHSEQVRVRKCMDEDVGCAGNREEWKRCHTVECQIDGGWSKWSKWTVCSTTCGSGQRHRYRKCNNPPPLNKGEICAGTNGQHEMCNPTPCPINGAWSEWSEWEACGGSCTNSTRRRTRQCTEPVPAFGGADCKGSSIEHVPCTQEGCPVDGQWTDWSPWSPCSATCGPSTRQRSRTCSNPEPQFGGAPCPGDSKETEVCPTSVCDNTPLEASIRLNGTLNGQSFSDTIHEVKVADLESQRTVDVYIRDVLKRQPGWFPYLQFLMSPLPWSTAFQKDGASNGHTLTQGRFIQTMHVNFDSGEELVVVHIGRGVGPGGVLRLHVSIEGEVPLFPLDTTVVVEPYEEDYIQTGPGELFAASSNTLNANGLMTSYSWSKTITYSSDLIMPHVLETLSVWDIKEEYSPAALKLSHKTSAAISMKPGSDSCPEGFQLNSAGPYCEDVDECADRRLNHCHVSQTCENYIGSYHCTCPSGMQATAIGAECLDVDECLLAPPVCSHHCVNTEGSFKCLCPPGLILLDNVTCSDVYLTSARRRSGDSGEVTESPISCPPGFQELTGVCQEINPCKDSPVMCTDDEICINMHGLYRCLAAPCPYGYIRDRVTKNCLVLCNESGAKCDTGAQLTETLKYVILTPESSSIPAYLDLTTLPIHDEDGRPRSHTIFRIAENEEGKPFRVKMEHGNGVLYSQTHLPAGRDYRVVIVALSYDDREEVVQHSTKFYILIRLSDDTVSLFRR